MRAPFSSVVLTLHREICAPGLLLPVSGFWAASGVQLCEGNHSVKATVSSCRPCLGFSDQGQPGFILQ